MRLTFVTKDNDPITFGRVLCCEGVGQTLPASSKLFLLADCQLETRFNPKKLLPNPSLWWANPIAEPII